MFQHHEAFKLMKYANQHGVVEWLWNSRDGVTPFGIAVAGITEARMDDERKTLRHVEWHSDVFMPFFVPPVGMRIFVSMSEERAGEIARRQVGKYWDAREFPMKERFATKEAAEKELVSAIYKNGHAPFVETVTPELNERFQKLAAERIEWPERLSVLHGN